MDVEMLDLIEEALDSTLRELQATRKRAARAGLPSESRVYWAADGRGLRSENLRGLSDMVASPAAVSLHAQLHKLGWLLFRHVETAERMQEIAEWVALLDVAAYDFRAHALQDAFAGVGVGDDVWA